ncbi:MAG: response regulator transcription factor [Deltaproteobacteria bacterium]|nr:response regulator transcription factor [Deltaproteobacteria bacterium]
MADRICLIEDDPTIRELVSEKLIQKGYRVDSFEQAEGVRLDSDGLFDLYIVDIMLSGEITGLDFCASIKRKQPTLPILILSALSEPNDRIEGLKAGADDYLTKPFEMEELLLRVEGMLKRRSWYSSLPSNLSVFEWGDCFVDFIEFKGCKGNKVFSLSQKECMLMKLLVEKENQVVTRDEILDRVWGYDVFPSSRTVDNFIVRLRKYFDNPGAPKYFHSIRGAGYKFTKKGDS